MVFLLTQESIEDESTAWDESQSKTINSIQSKKSVTYKDDFQDEEEKEQEQEEEEKSPEKSEEEPTPALSNNRSNNEEEDSEDDWMDDLDEALAKQGYGGL